LSIHAAADLESAGIGGECGTGGGFIPGPEHDDVAAGETVFPIQLGEPFGGTGGDKIRAQAGIAKRAADDLLHFTFMEVNARSKHGGKLDSRGTGAKRQMQEQKIPPPDGRGILKTKLIIPARI
jgi:hypothetical protein